MPRYLSQEWMDETNENLAADPQIATLSKGKRASIQQHISGYPGIDGTYDCYITVDDGKVFIGQGVIDDPDVSMKANYELLCEVHRGETQIALAAMSGKVNAKGNLAKLLGLRKVQTAIDEVMQRGETTY